LTLAAATGASLKDLMARGGHDDYRAAMRYQHASEDRDRIVADALSTFVKPAGVTPIRKPNERRDKGRVRTRLTVHKCPSPRTGSEQRLSAKTA
jgi:hypothetical protein